MNVHLFVGFQFAEDFVPRYVVPTIVVVFVVIFVGSWTWEHIGILRKQKAQASQKGTKTTVPIQKEADPVESIPDSGVGSVESSNVRTGPVGPEHEGSNLIELVMIENGPAESVLEETVPAELSQSEIVAISAGEYSGFFLSHAHDPSRRSINTVAIPPLIDEHLKGLTEDERWFVEWYHTERKKGITHWSTPDSLVLEGLSQEDVCKRLRETFAAANA
jgi:hypothetical protein